MQSNRFDAIVMGAGLSGLTAAAVAAAQSRRVALVAIGAGAFVLDAGCVSANEARQLSAQPDFEDAIAFICKATAAAGCALDADLRSPRRIPSLLGGFEGVSLAPRGVWKAAYSAGARTAIAGFGGMSGFDAEFLAERLNNHARAHGLAPVYTAKIVALPSDLGTPLTTLRIANRFDRDAGFRAALASALREAATGFDRVLLPSVLGLHSTDGQLAGFEREVGCGLGELATLPPCIPGLRVYNRLLAALRGRGVEVFEGYPADLLEIADGVCTGLRIASPGRGLLLHADAVVLATESGSRALLSEFTGSCDERQHPLSPSGAPIARNLFAALLPQAAESKPDGHAGQILAGYRAAVCACAERGEYAAR
jgi:glycerol-3-phosphate dehydrogenase subunit B